MNETERKAYLEQFNRRTHVLGRIVSAITLVLLVGAGIFAYHHHEEAAKQAAARIPSESCISLSVERS